MRYFNLNEQTLNGLEDDAAGGQVPRRGVEHDVAGCQVPRLVLQGEEDSAGGQLGATAQRPGKGQGCFRRNRKVQGEVVVPHEGWQSDGYGKNDMARVGRALGFKHEDLGKSDIMVGMPGKNSVARGGGDDR